MSATHCSICGKPWATHGTACEPSDQCELVPAAGSDTTVRIGDAVDIIVTAKTTGRRFVLRCPNPTSWHELNDVAGELMRQSLLLRPNDELKNAGPRTPDVRES